jgi:hypothetical protein
MKRKNQNPPDQVAAGENTEKNPEEIILFVGNPPALRTLLELGESCRVVVIRDLTRALKFMSETRVSRVLMDLGSLSPRLAPITVAARPGYDTEANHEARHSAR